jgi:hypothetical protein
VDVWVGALDRRAPQPLLVNGLTELIEQRRCWMVGWVRQACLGRTLGPDALFRCARALAPFPDIPLKPVDHQRAALRSHELARRSIPCLPTQALLWVVAERIDAAIWSTDPRWWPLEQQGCPLWQKAR